MHSLLSAIEEYNTERNYVLAIITDCCGSTYRKTGAMMLIEQSQNYWGLLSGGCLEGDIVAHCENVFSDKQDQLIEYNMRDEADMLWGMGLGCDGEITILLKYLPAAQQHFGFFDAISALDQGSSQRLSIDLQNHKINFSTAKPGEFTTIKQQNHLHIVMQAPHHLLICGGAPDVPPVTAIAKQIGWKTTVIDHRRDYASKSKFPFANQVNHIKRSEWQTMDLQPFDSAIIMSHQFERDQSYLSRLLKSPINYLGLLGPAKRRDRLLAECGSHFSEQQGRVYGPIGLDIGAGSPETIALAIISEIQAVKSNKSVGFCYQDPNR